MGRRMIGFGCLVWCLFLWGLPPTQAEEIVFVKRVIDGDTIVLKDGRPVRYIGINAPEVAHGSRIPDPFAKDAHRLNARLVLGENVRLSFDREKKDQYGRTLAYVFFGEGRFANAEILAAGLAHVLRRPPNEKYGKQLLAVQRRAMEARIGIWRNWRPANRRYIGNRRSKRFHLETCPYGRQTATSNLVIFDSAWEAFWNGFAPGKKCDAWSFSEQIRQP